MIRTPPPPPTEYQRYKYNPKKKRNTFTPEELATLKYVDKHIDRIAKEDGYFKVKHDPGIDPELAARQLKKRRDEYYRQNKATINARHKANHAKRCAARAKEEVDP